MSDEMITSEQVKAFWKYMSNKYGFTVVEKANSEEMKAVAWALDAMGIKDHEEFMKRYTTTLGRIVYINFKIGVGNVQQLWKQVKICVHETQHVVQYLRDSVVYMINYLRSKASRAHYEVDAYRTNQEMHYFFYGNVPKVYHVINKLRGYMLNSGDLHVAKKHLIVSRKVIQQGMIVSGVSKTAINWWRKNGIKGHKVVFSS